jgi:hypothetical protein
VTGLLGWVDGFGSGFDGVVGLSSGFDGVVGCGGGCVGLSSWVG